MKKAFPYLILSTLWCLLASAQSPVQSEAGYWLIDEFGDTLNRAPYDYIHPKGKEHFLVVDGGDFFYINDSGRKWWNQTFQVAYPFKGPYALVRKEGAYRYLSREGLYFDSLAWPKAPIVYKDFLLYGEDSTFVVSPDGSRLLKSTHPLFAASECGIFEWDKAQGVVRQYIGRDKRSFRLANTFEEVDTLAFNHQGYAFIESDSLFSVYDDRGQMLFENQARSNYYLSVQIMWGAYLFVDRLANLSYQFENEIGAEPMIDASQSVYRDIDNRFGGAVLLAESFRNEGVAQIRGSEKWGLYRQRNTGIEGPFLFDEVLPSDDNDQLLVRQGLDWYLFDVNKEVRYPLDYRYIHPFGYAEGRFYGSNDPQADFWSKRWAYHHWEDSFQSAEVYRFTDPKLARHTWSPLIRRQMEFPDLLKLWRNDSLFLVNSKGEALAYDAARADLAYTLENYLMPEFHLHARDVKALEKKNDYKRRQFKPYLELKEGKLFASLVNNTKDTVRIQTLDWHLTGFIEYRYSYEPEKWRPITRLQPEFISDYSESYALPPKHILQREVPFPPGDAYVALRLRVEVSTYGEALYSEPLMVSIPSSAILGHPYLGEFGARNFFEFQWKTPSYP